MDTVESALEKMLSAASPLPAQTLPLAAALGRTLAAAVTARRPQPPESVSAMDGFALASADSPGELRLVGESQAGRPFAGRLSRGECVRISTGAVVPQGADAIVLQEETPVAGDRVSAPHAAEGRHVRPRGFDFTQGAKLLAPGLRLGPAQIALAAAAGADRLELAPLPRAAILTGGEEIVAPGGAPAPFQVYDSAGPGVAALAALFGGSPMLAPLLPDDPERFAQALEAALATADIAVLIGGASVGKHDHAKSAARALGATFLVDGVALRPGKPTWFAQIGGKPVLGLPGNPASALVCARLFLAPLLAQMSGGEPGPLAMRHRARLAVALPANGPRSHFLRAHLAPDASGVLHIRPFEVQDSALLSVFAMANALLAQPAHGPALSPGSIVEWLPWPNPGSVWP